MKSKLRAYRARWFNSDTLLPRADVSFTASNDQVAKRKADKIAIDVQSANSPRTLSCEGRIVEEMRLS